MMLLPWAQGGWRSNRPAPTNWKHTSTAGRTAGLSSQLRGVHTLHRLLAPTQRRFPFSSKQLPVQMFVPDEAAFRQILDEKPGLDGLRLNLPYLLVVDAPWLQLQGYSSGLQSKCALSTHPALVNAVSVSVTKSSRQWDTWAVWESASPEPAIRSSGEKSSQRMERHEGRSRMRVSAGY